ncbi:hypothetical protein TEA_011796 [Camellia sinensis var. sinensis]|uniref:ABC transmembrane type-1 domain-containing protein n=1 Tax=Camellia sinensis var. sinensis TaxID=542762 RepID=A0A4S4DTB9_CAMSN|nr:hypothetical protein TEA_011796 [Camellia sinensis var. sinensis]
MEMEFHVLGVGVVLENMDGALASGSVMAKPNGNLETGSIASVILGLVMTLFGVLLANIIKIFYEPAHELRKDSKFWASMFVLLGVVALLATSIRTYVFASAGCRLIKRIQLMCFEKVVHMEIDALALIFQNSATAIAGLVIAFQETGYYSGHGASCRT